MDLPDSFASLIEALRQHIPTGDAWMPAAFTAGVALLGLIVLFRGARLAPYLIALAFTLLGGLGGSLASGQFGVTLWPAVAAGGVVGFALGLVLFRLWMALQVSALLIVAALLVYSTRLAVPLHDYVSKEFDVQTQEVTLLAPGEVAPASQPWNAQLVDLWAYMGAQVPSFHASFIAIVISSGIAGLVFAGLMPKAARSFWAATLGTSLFLTAGWALLSALWPQATQPVGRWGLLIAAGLWAVSLIWNMVDLIGPRKPRPAATVAEQAAA